MKDAVIQLHPETELDIPPNRVLDAAKDRLDVVIVAGWDKETGELYFASSTPQGGNIIWLLEKFKNFLMGL